MRTRPSGATPRLARRTIRRRTLATVVAAAMGSTGVLAQVRPEVDDTAIRPFTIRVL